MSSIELFVLYHYSHYTQNSRSIIGSSLKVLVPVALLSILNASPTIVERRLFYWMSNSNINQSKISGTDDDKIFNFTRNPDNLDENTSEDKISSVFKKLVDEHLIFKIIQVFTLTIIPAFMLIYYNLKIFQGVIKRQRLLIPRERIFNQQLKVRKGGKKKEYDLKKSIEEWQKASQTATSNLKENDEDKAPINAIKCYPTIGTFKHTTDLLTLPVTLPGIDAEGHYANSTQRSSSSGSSTCSTASNKRQYEDKLAFENMVNILIFKKRFVCCINKFGLFLNS